MRSQQDPQVAYQELSGMINERRYVISDAGVSHRWITHWQEKGLLLGYYEQGKWRKFDLVEMVWLKTIIKLRQFGTPLSTIKILRDNLMEPADPKPLLTSEEIRAEILEKHPELTRPKLDTILDEEPKQLATDPIPDMPPTLFLIVMDVLLEGAHWYMLVGEKDQIGYLKMEEWNKISRMEGFDELFYRSHIALSINEVVAEALGGIDLTHIEGHFQLISANEAEIIRQIRFGQLKTLTIHFGKKREPIRIEATRVKKVETEARLMEIILAHGYQKLELETVNGKVVYCEDTVRKKF